jgi:hypothetical protein
MRAIDFLEYEKEGPLGRDPGFMSFPYAFPYATYPMGMKAVKRD